MLSAAALPASARATARPARRARPVAAGAARPSTSPGCRCWCARCWPGAPPVVLDLRGGLPGRRLRRARRAARRRAGAAPAWCRPSSAGCSTPAARRSTRCAATTRVLVGGAALDRRAAGAGPGRGRPGGHDLRDDRDRGGCVYDGRPARRRARSSSSPTAGSGSAARRWPTATSATPSDRGRVRRRLVPHRRPRPAGATGRLEVLGRADDVIVTGGEKVAPGGGGAGAGRAAGGARGVRGRACRTRSGGRWSPRPSCRTEPPAARPGAAPADAVRAELGRAAVPRVAAGRGRAPAARHRQARPGAAGAPPRSPRPDADRRRTRDPAAIAIRRVRTSSAPRIASRLSRAVGRAAGADSVCGVATLAQWVEGARPRTLPTAVAPVLVGTGAAIGHGVVAPGGRCWRWSSRWRW